MKAFLDLPFVQVALPIVITLILATVYQNKRIDDLGKRMDDLRSYMDKRFDEVYRRFSDVDRRFDEVFKRFDKIDAKLENHADRLVKVEERTSLVR